MSTLMRANEINISANDVDRRLLIFVDHSSLWISVLTGPTWICAARHGSALAGRTSMSPSSATTRKPTGGTSLTSASSWLSSYMFSNFYSNFWLIFGKL